MLAAKELKKQAQVLDAAYMMGTDVNKDLLQGGGLLGAEAEIAQANDLIIAVKSESESAQILDLAEDYLSTKTTSEKANTDEIHSLRSAIREHPDANMAVISIAGAYAAMTVVLFIAAKVKNMITLLIAGLMMGYLCHAVTSVLVAFAEQEKLKMFVLWQLGSFSGLKWSEIRILFIFGGLILVLVYALSKPLNAFLLGEAYASTMGVNIRVFRFFIIFCSCALAGMVTAVAGPVAFIGLAVPHMTRLCFVTSDNRILIPGTVLLGAIVTGLCDLIARLAFSPVELPISSITAFFGAPIVISLLIKRKVSV